MHTKTCRRCKLTLPAESFSVNKAIKDGLTSYCKTCLKLYDQAYLNAHREEVRKKNLEWRNSHREQHNATQRARYARRKATS